MLLMIAGDDKRRPREDPAQNPAQHALYNDRCKWRVSTHASGLQYRHRHDQETGETLALVIIRDAAKTQKITEFTA